MPVSKSIKIPSVKAFLALGGVDKAQAKAMRAVMMAYPPLGVYRGRASHDFNPDEGNVGALTILDIMYDTHGVADFTMKHRNGQTYTIYYLNSGDPYTTTIMYIKPSRGNPRYEVGCWGDYAEREVRREE